ncbi:MAG TPA: type II secretion system F family protein [Acetobacteraceae bacterium]|nr:type II secretion system F family protein [Acetobacteraceae bacterium]
MPEFHYVAIDPSGALARGTMEAPDPASVIERLRRAGNLPVSAVEATRRSALLQLLQTDIGRGGALSRQELTEAMRELATMLGAGQDLDRALRYLVETAPNRRVRTVFGRVRDAVRDGGTLAAAMEAEPRSFPRLLVGLVRAGEAGGALAPTLERLAVLFERERSLVSTVRSAMVYPVLLMITAGGSVTLLLTRVLPQFVPLFEQNGVALPQSTAMLLGVGNFVSNYGLYAASLALMLALALRAALRRPGPRALADAALLRLPVLGGLARETMAARFSRTLGTLLINGVPLLAALGIVRDTLGNLAGVAAVDRATASVRDGGGLARPLEGAKIFPPRTVSLIRLGEETAELGPIALRAAEIHEEQVRLGVQRLVALLVPAITIIMGAVVAAIVGSLLQAMLGLDNLAQ